MKTLNVLLTLSFLPIGISSFAQPYQPVGVENAHWFMYATPDGIISDHHAFAVRGDTLINSMAYKKLYYQDFAPAPVFLLEEEYLWGVVRDDSLERKVYVIAFEPYVYGYQCPIGEEQLLFDFSILPGDSTAQCLWVEDHPWILDSTFVTNKYGADRKTLFTSHYDGIQSEIYEGIGSNNGLLGTLTYMITISEDYYWLIKYCIGSDEDCGIISGVRDAPDPGLAVSIFPNPAHDMLFLSSEAAVSPETLVYVFDSYGRQVFAGTFTDAQKGISLQNWPAGLYCLDLRDKGRRLCRNFIRAGKF